MEVPARDEEAVPELGVAQEPPRERGLVDGDGAGEVVDRRRGAAEDMQEIQRAHGARFASELSLAEIRRGALEA